MASHIFTGKTEFNYVHLAFTKFCKNTLYKITLNQKNPPKNQPNEQTKKKYFLGRNKYKTCTSRARKKDYEGLTVGESILLSILMSYNMSDYLHIQKSNCLMTKSGLSSLLPDSQLSLVRQVDCLITDPSVSWDSLATWRVYVEI